jgi:arginase family enzyme
VPAQQGVSSTELLLAVEKLERKIDSLSKDLTAVNARVEAMQQWLTWMARLLLGSLMTLLLTSAVTLLLQR